MVDIRHRPSHFDPTKVRLTPSVLRILVLCIFLIQGILLWNRVDNAGVDDVNGSDKIAAINNGAIGGGGGSPVVIPFIVSMTDCGNGDDPFEEGAAVLKYSIHLTSIHGPLGGRYDYKMYAIYHPNATECAKSLEDLGYTLVERETPVAVEDIEGEYLRSRIEKNGCCGSKELVKLEAFTFTQYPIVVHLDMDVIFLKPIDILFDVMLDTTGDLSKYASQLDVMWPNKTLPNRVDAFFTRDFGMVKYGRKIFPVQGGLLILRPSMDDYHELVATVKKGDFDEKKGWGAKTGLFYGSMTIQGLLPYYYDVIHNGERAVDLNRCIYNQMCDKPRSENKQDPAHPRCNTGEENCEDCRLRPVEDLVSVHFTNCLKPWHCVAHHNDDIEHWLCRKIHHEWFRIRSSLEENWGRNAIGPGKWFHEQFFGFCSRHGKKGYQKISRPFLPTFN